MYEGEGPALGAVFSCDELYFASFTPNLMPPSALIQHCLLPLLVDKVRTFQANVGPRPLVLLLDRSDLPSLYPEDALRPRRRLLNHAEVLAAGPHTPPAASPLLT
jgi:hypothetical protein